jgi:tetratricopeptide (TPR) repeat protein
MATIYTVFQEKEKKMKAEHRHELKTNVLDEWIANFPQWAKKNLRMIIFVSAAVIIVGGSALFLWYRKNVESVRKQLELTRLVSQLSQGKLQVLQSQVRGMDVSYMLIQIADGLENFARNAKDDQMAALALVKRAEALRTELHYRFGTVSEQDTKAAIERAKASYTEAIGKSVINQSLVATAKLGLGLCEEELGNFEQAKQIYTEMATSVDFEGTAASAAAKHRLETMADYQQEVVFAPAPQPPPVEPAEPELTISAAEVNAWLEGWDDALEDDVGLPESVNDIPNSVPGE